MVRTSTPTRFVSARGRQANILMTAAAGAIAALYAGQPALAGTEIQFSTGGALTTAGNYSSAAVPTNINDVRITTTTTGLTISAANVVMESLNNPGGTSYTISNATTTATNRTLTLGNTAGFTNAVSGVNDDLIYLGGTGSLTLNGTNSSSGTGSLGLTLTSAGNFNIGASNATLTLNTIITGTSAITKTGAGTLVLGNNGNSGTLVLPTGGLVLNAGTLQINGGGALGSVANGGGVTLTGNATIRNSGTSATAGIGSTRTFAIGTNNLTLDTAGNSFNVNNAITGTTGNVAVTNGGLIGFTNANTYAGTTTFTAAAGSTSGLTLSNTNASSGYTITNAALTLTSAGSFTNPTAPSINLTNASFVVGTGRAAPLTVGGLTITSGVNRVDAGSQGVALGAITRTAGTADFTLPAAGSLTTTTTNSGNGLLGGWATANSGAAFATSAGTGGTAGAITASGPGSTNYATADGTTNFDAATSGTLSGGGVNSIRITAPSTVTLGGATTVTSGGVLVTPTAGATVSTITGGSLTSGDANLYVHQYDTAAPLTLASPVVDGAGTVGLFKAGPGKLIVSGTNSNTGVNTIGAGTLEIGDGVTGSLGGGNIVDNGVLSFNLPGVVTTAVPISGSGSVEQNNPGTLVMTVTTSYTGGTTINAGTIQFATTNFAGTGGIRINNGALRQTAALSSGRTFTLGSANSSILVSNGFSFLISGSVTGAGTLNVNSTTSQSTTGVPDTGNLTLTSSSNTYTGGTVLNAGTMAAYFGGSLGTGPLTMGNNTRITFNNVGSTANTASTFSGALVLNGTGTVQVGNSTFRNTLTIAGPVSGSGSLVKTGPGSITFTSATPSTYTGGTVVNQGVLIGTAGSFGTGDLTINPTSITGGTQGLAIDAAGVTSVGSIAPTANVTVNNSAVSTGVSGTLTLEGTGNAFATLAGNGQVIVGAAAPTTLTVGGGTVSAANTTFSGVISGSGAITKAGAGTQVLTGANTYAGVTTVTGGTLELGAAAQTPVLGGTNGADIQDGQIAFDYNGASPATTIRGLLKGSFDDATTPGIMETGLLRSTTATIARGIGYRDTGTSVLVRATLFGDADLDGGVSINDFNALAGNFGAGSGKVWVDGDFDYDGGVSINDFNLLAGGFGQSVPAGSDLWAGLLAFAAAHDDMAAFAAITGVPEPTSLGLIAAGATLGLRRRRR